MYRFFLAVVDIIPATVVLLPLFLILHFTAYKRNRRKSVRYCLFCLYLAAVFSLVGIPNMIYISPGINLNWIPFAGMLADLKNCILNVVLFVPLGCFLPLLWARFRNRSACIAVGFGLSLAVELLQMLTYRATDVNDLITNTAGTLLGFSLAKTLTGRFDPAGEDDRDLYVLIALSFGVMFFLHPILSPMIWDAVL